MRRHSADESCHGSQAAADQAFLWQSVHLVALPSVGLQAYTDSAVSESGPATVEGISTTCERREDGHDGLEEEFGD